MPWSESRYARRRAARRRTLVLTGEDVFALIPTKPTASDGLRPITLDGVAPAYLADVPASVLRTTNGAEHRAYFQARLLQVPTLWDVKQELRRRHEAVPSRQVAA